MGLSDEECGEIFDLAEGNATANGGNTVGRKTDEGEQSRLNKVNINIVLVLPAEF